LRGSQDSAAGKQAIYIVNAWATQNQLVLGQRKVDEKSNEITAIPKLLKHLNLAGCIVTVDALNTQTQVAKTIKRRRGEYILAVKENQGHLYEDIVDLFSDDRAYNFRDAPYQHTKQVSKDHGRLEIRERWTISDPEYLAQIRDLDHWSGVQTLVLIVSERGIWEQIELQERYFISSLENNAERILQAKRHY
jgi:predicted transposase YbfD/YdcC